MEQEKVNDLVQLFLRTFGSAPASVIPLPGAGSNRVYFRLTGKNGSTCIGCVGTSSEENRSFIRLSDHFCSKGMPMPKVFDHNDDYTIYLQQDLGSLSLFDFLKEGREKGGDYSELEVERLRWVMQDLPRIQFLGGSPETFQYCYPQQSMDSTSVMFDLNYFKYCFLKLSGLEFNEYRLQADFERLCSDLLLEDADTFLYRDFQARNVMLVGDTPYYIDFQGGRRGPIYYDVASFLWQASAHYSDDLRRQLIDTYWESLQDYITAPDCPPCYRELTRDGFDQRLRLFVFFRILQVLGAYGFRGLWEKKKHFIDSIPPALENLRSALLQGSADDYPYLKEVLEQLESLPLTGLPSVDFVTTQESSSKLDSPFAAQKSSGLNPLNSLNSKLIVRVFSFSFKKGIPEDTSGNGGGYVFDCRSSNNPGRYEQYKTLTGLDRPVIDFLEQDGEILQFLSHIYPIVDFHAQRWIDRGFTDLQISFGCTGGQHRSVYCAQHVAEHLHDKFGVEVHLCHRERGITQVLK